MFNLIVARVYTMFLLIFNKIIVNEKIMLTFYYDFYVRENGGETKNVFHLLEISILILTVLTNELAI